MKFDEGIPIYLQIKELVENAIISGALKEEETIPSIRTLAKEYRVNPQTISNAVNELLNEGVIYKRRGIGMFVEKKSQRLLLKKKTELFISKELVSVVVRGKALGIEMEKFKQIITEIYEQGEK